jgi:hypothetical protein
MVVLLYGCLPYRGWFGAWEKYGRVCGEITYTGFSGVSAKSILVGVQQGIYKGRCSGIGGRFLTDIGDIRQRGIARQFHDEPPWHKCRNYFLPKIPIDFLNFIFGQTSCPVLLQHFLMFSHKGSTCHIKICPLLFHLSDSFTSVQNAELRLRHLRQILDTGPYLQMLSFRIPIVFDYPPKSTGAYYHARHKTNVCAIGELQLLIGETGEEPSEYSYQPICYRLGTWQFQRTHRRVSLYVLAIVWLALLFCGAYLLTDYDNGIGGVFILAGWMVMWLWCGMLFVS